jgi:hypothetical protein
MSGEQCVCGAKEAEARRGFILNRESILVWSLLPVLVFTATNNVASSCICI